MNVVLDGVLDGGVNDALNLDSHGKALSFLLLELPLEVPTALAAAAARPRFPEPLRRQTMNASTRRSVMDPARCRRVGAGGVGPDLPRQADRLHRAVRRRQRHRPAGARARPVDHRDHQAGGGGRQQGRRQRHARRAGSGACAGRRLHGADHHQHHAGGQRAPVQEAAVRPGEGLRAGHAASARVARCWWWRPTRRTSR